MEKLISILLSKMNDKSACLNEIKSWRKISFDQSQKFNPKLGSDIKQIREVIREKTKFPLKGVYIYLDKNEVLYIGKTKRFSNAIHRHYNEAHKLGGDKKYQDFFSRHLKPIAIYFKEIDSNYSNDEIKNEALRIILERMIIAGLRSSFDIENPSIK